MCSAHVPLGLSEPCSSTSGLPGGSQTTVHISEIYHVCSFVGDIAQTNMFTGLFCGLQCADSAAAVIKFLRTW